VAVSKAARREARVREIAAAFARRAAPGFIAKGAGSPAIDAYLPIARIYADTEADIRANGKLIRKLNRLLESMQPAEPAMPAMPAGLHAFDPAKWDTRLVPSTAPPKLNGHDPLAPYRDDGADG
jgi:hypothetical protein